MTDRPIMESTEGEKQTGRIEAFSDGVLAIVSTLLALEGSGGCRQRLTEKE